jgi:hypothetical protein
MAGIMHACGQSIFLANIALLKYLDIKINT